jgi:hypothetical protein
VFRTGGPELAWIARWHVGIDECGNPSDE